MQSDGATTWLPEAGGSAFPLPPLVCHDSPCQAPPLPHLAAPLVEELPASLDAWEACRRLCSLPHLLFLDSSARHPTLGRYSFLTADPFHWLVARGSRVELDGVQRRETD